MPPLPRLRIGTLDDLARHLCALPREMLRERLMDAERLAEEVTAEGMYAEDWVVSRLTSGPAELPNPAMLVGSALLADLVSLVERLSAAAGLGEEEMWLPEGVEAAGHSWLTARDVCARWGVSGKTLARYRKLGLLGRRVVMASGRERLVFSLRAVERFERAHAGRLEEAERFTRMDDATRAEIVRRAERYRSRLGLSLNQIATRLGPRFGRSVETVRHVLQRREAEGGARLFDEPGPLSDRQGRVIHRAMSRGIGAREIGARYRKTASAIVRAHAAVRAELLRGLDLVVTGRGANEADGKVEVWLEHAAVARLEHPLLPRSYAELRGVYGGVHPLPPAVELALARGYAALRVRAARGIAALPRHRAAPGALDEIETDLRWATLLKGRLVASQLGLMLQTLDDHRGVPLTTLPALAASDLLTRTIQSVSEAVDRFDPWRPGGRLAAPVGLAVIRTASGWSRGAGVTTASPGGATRRTAAESIVLPDWAGRLCAWQRFLDPDPRVRGGLVWAGMPERAVVAAHFGFMPVRDDGAEGGVGVGGGGEMARAGLVDPVSAGGGGMGSEQCVPPMTLAAISGVLGVPAFHAARLARRGVRAILDGVRSGRAGPEEKGGAA